MATSIEKQVAAAYKAAVGLDMPASNLAARVAEIQSGAQTIASYTAAINSSTKAQVSQAYQQATGKVPTQAALDSAVAQVNSGATTVSALKSDIADTKREVAAAYKQATGVDMPADKLAQRVSEIESGATTLDEYKTAVNASTRAQVAQAYKAATGSDMPAEKLEQRVAEINSGATTLDEYKTAVNESSRAKIAQAFSWLTGEAPSSEVLESYVNQVKDGVQTVDDIKNYFGLIGDVAIAYKQAVGSDIPVDKLMQRVGEIQSGALTLDEYKGAVGASTRAQVAKAYKDAIGLDMPTEKLEQRLSEIKSGKTTLDAYVTNLNNSPRAIIAKEYQTATGHAPTSEWLESYVTKFNTGTPFETIKTDIANIPEAQDKAYNLTAKDNIPKFYTQAYTVGDYGYSLKTNPDGSPVFVLNNNAIQQDYHGYIDDLYQRLLNRPASEQEHAAFEKDKWFYTKTEDQAGALSNAVLIERAVLNSPEFQSKSSNRSVWVTDGRTGNPVLIPSEIAKLPKIGDLISNGGMVDFTPQTKMLAENVYPEAYVEVYNSEGGLTKTLDTNKLLSAIAADPTRYVNSLFATVSGGIKREQMIGQAGFANSGVSNDSLKTLATTAQDYFNYLTKSGSTVADLQKIYTDAQTNIERTTAQSIADQKDTGSGWIDEIGDFLEKYEVTIMLAIAAPVMGAGLAAVAAGGVAAAGATAAVGSAAATAATAAGVGFAGMAGTTLAGAITASIMGVANTGIALGNGASWQDALKTGVLSSGAAFAGAQLGSQIGGALKDTLINQGMSAAAATQVASTVTNSVTTSLSSGVAAAINGKDISDAMLISGIGAAIGSSLAGATGSTQIGNIAGGTAAGVVAGKDFGTAMQDSLISGAVSLINGLVKDGATGTYEKLKETFSTYLGASDQASSWLATGTEKYNGKDNGNWTLTDRIAQAMNPEFDPEAYRRINGIGTGVDAGTDYLTRGMEAGAPVNAKEAAPMIADARSDAIRAIAKEMGYTDLMKIPPEKIADLGQKLDGIFGDNLSAWKSANLGSIIADNPDLKASDLLSPASPSVSEQALSKNLLDKALAPGWYKPSSSVFSMPSGMKFATQDDIASGKGIYSAIDKEGHTVYITKDANYTPPKVYDSSTGNFKPGTSDILGTKTFDNMSAEERLAFLNSVEKGTLSDPAKENLIKQAGATGIEDAKHVVATVTNSKLSTESKDSVLSFISGAANVSGWFGTALQDAAKFSSVLDYMGAGQAGQELSAWASNISNTVNAARSEEALASSQRIQNTLNSAKGVMEGGQSWWQVLKNESKEVLSGMWTSELAETLMSEGSAGAATAGIWATASAMGKDLGAEFLVKKLFIPINAAYDGLEAYADGKTEYQKRVYDVLINTGMSRELAQQESENVAIKAGMVKAASAATISAGSDIVGAKILFGNSGSGVIDMAKKFFGLEGVSIVSDLGQGATNKAIEEAFIYNIDPNQSDMSTKATQGALIQATLGRGVGTVTNASASILTTAYLSNKDFQDAIKSTGTSLVSLKQVFDSWVPPAAQMGTSNIDIRSTLLPAVFNENEGYANGFGNAQSFMDAVKDEFGVWQPIVLADVAASVPKFSNQIITYDAGLKLLKDNGIENPTAQDVINSGVLGVIDTNKNTLLSNYISTVTGKPPVAPIVPIEPPSQPATATDKALQEALGRDPTSEEALYWNNLSNTQGQSAALTQIGAIPYIIGTYKSVFNAEPTAEQIALWSQKLGAGEATYGNLSNLMKGSTGQTTETKTPTGYTDAQIYTLKNQILDKVDQYQAQGYTFDQAVQAAVSTIANTSNVSSSDLLSKLGTTTNALKTEFSSQFGTIDDNLADLIAKNENYGMNRETATQKAISELATQRGMSETAVKSYVDIASSQFQNEIEVAKTDLGKQLAPIQTAAPQIMTDIQKQMQDYVSAGLDPSIALDLAVSTVAQDRNITKTNLLSGLKTSVATLQQALVPTKTDVQTVAQLVGKPASQVTTADMQAVKSMVDQQIATNLLYDVNQDQKVDTTDLQLLQQQQQIQQQQNIKTVVDPNTGVKTYIDTTTNKPVTGFDVTGTQWAPTGIYEEGDTESTKKQKNQFGQLVDKLFQIPEVSQQLVKVDTPPPSHINYIYDFSSIFATPSQASLMPSPYGATNTVMPQQKQGGIMGQAANDVYGAPYKMAVGGFAEGGIVNSNDIQVGDGGSIDDLINILKGNG